MICKKCLQEINDDSIYCKYCGSYVLENRVYHVKKNKKMNRLLYILLALMLMIAMVYRTDFSRIEQKNQDTLKEIHVLDTSELEERSNLNNAGNMVVINDFVYMIDGSGNMIQTSRDFKEPHIFLKGTYSYLTSDEDNLIFTDEFYHIFRCNGKSKEIEKLVDSPSYYLMIEDHYLYFQNDQDGESIYRYDLKTGREEKLVDDHCYNLNILEQKIYYTTNEGIFSYDLTSQEIKQIASGLYAQLVVLDNHLYALQSERLRICDINLDNLTMKEITSDSLLEFVCNDGYIIMKAIDETTKTSYLGVYDRNEEDYYYYDLRCDHLAINSHYAFFINDVGQITIFDLEDDRYTELEIEDALSI